VLLKNWPLIAGVGIELDQEGKGAKQVHHQQRDAIAVLDVVAMDNGMHQQTLGVDEDMPLVALDFLPHILAGRMQAPFFSAVGRIARN
jgi:hypothetical protein